MLIQRKNCAIIALLALAMIALFISNCRQSFVPPQSGTLEKPFSHSGGSCYSVHLPQFASWGDTMTRGQHSNLVLFEDDIPLGPSHSLHELIRNKGKGRYSHWGWMLHFSSSENTDPNTNGKTYTYTITPKPAPYIREQGIFFLTAAFLAGVGIPLVLGLFSTWGKQRILLLLVGSTGTLLAFFVSRNVIDVSTLSGKSLYGLTTVIFWGGFVCINFLLHRSLSGKSRLFSVLLCWSMLSFFVWGAESAFRAFPVHSTQGNNPGAGFFWPEWQSVARNSMGFRGPEIQKPKPKGVYRIIAAGDSFVEGAGVPQSENFCARLQKTLNQRMSEGREIQVLNWGRCGANLRSSVSLLKTHAQAVAPDLILLFYHHNDVDMDPPAILPYDPPAWLLEIHSAFLKKCHSYLYHRVYENVTFFGKNLSFAEHRKLQYQTTSSNWKNVEVALSEFDELKKNIGADAVGFVFPLFQRELPKQSYSETDRQLKQALDAMQKHGLESYDLKPVFVNCDKNLGNFALSSHDHHPSAAAHAILGTYLSRFVKNRSSYRTFLHKGTDNNESFSIENKIQ